MQNRKLLLCGGPNTWSTRIPFHGAGQLHASLREWFHGGYLEQGTMYSLGAVEWILLSADEKKSPLVTIAIEKLVS
jgi:hypothetical protein